MSVVLCCSPQTFAVAVCDGCMCGLQQKTAKCRCAAVHSSTLYGPLALRPPESHISVSEMRSPLEMTSPLAPGASFPKGPLTLLYLLNWKHFVIHIISLSLLGCC